MKANPFGVAFWYLAFTATLLGICIGVLTAWMWGASIQPWAVILTVIGMITTGLLLFMLWNHMPGAGGLSSGHGHTDKTIPTLYLESDPSKTTNSVQHLVSGATDDLSAPVASIGGSHIGLPSRVIESIEDPLFVFDNQWHVLLANGIAEQMSDIGRRELTGSGIREVFNDPVLVKKIIDAIMLADTPEHPSFEYEVTRTNHRQVYQVSVTEIVEAESGLEGDQDMHVLVAFHDITKDRQRLESARNFVSSVSHELRTPLSSIKAYMELLIDGEACDEHQRTEFYSIIHSETERLGRLIDTILDIGRIESGVASIKREVVDLVDVVHEVIDVIHPQARVKKIKIHLDYEQKTRPCCDVHRDMIYQATMNLLINAVKYTMRNGTITVTIRDVPTSGWVYVSITDTGVGIPDLDLPKIFDKCYRVPEHRKLATGTGLGLNLVKQIIEVMHSGKVQVESTLGQGSTFTYCLPIAENCNSSRVMPSRSVNLLHAR